MVKLLKLKVLLLKIKYDMNWKKSILEQNKSIQQAIKKIDSSSIKIILVIDSKKKLVGTITDGDIRRCF